MTASSAQNRDPHQLSYGQLSVKVGEMRDALARVSPRREIVAIVMYPQLESVAALLAADSLSRPAILLPPALADGERRDLLLENGVTLLCAPEATDRTPRPWDPPPETRWDRLRQPGGDAPQTPGPSLDDAFVMQLTSGSTGAARLAVRTRRGVLAEIAAVTERLSLCEDDRILCASSIAHSYGLMGGLLAGLLAGAHVALARDAAEASALTERAAPSVILGLSSTYRHMLDHGPTLPSPRYALSAGAPLPAGLFQRFLDRSGVPLRQDYGTTETGTITIDASQQPGPDTVGAPLPHLELRLDDDLHGTGRPENSQEVLMRRREEVPAYLRGGASFPCVDDDGWYRTGDRGVLNARGDLQLAGRVRPPVVVRGVRVDLDQVERAVSQVAGVAEAIAIPVDVEGDGQGIRTFVVPDASLSDNLEEHCREAAAFLAPVVIAVRDALPRSPAGKILHKELK